jgi:hypothetical protein
MREKSVRKQIDSRRQRHERFKISDLKFQIEETANSKANVNGNTNTNSNADASSLKGLRDDGVLLRLTLPQRQNQLPFK